MKRYDVALAWFRRDLRSHNRAALYHALKEARQVHCVFVFDTEILDRLGDREDRRVEFIWWSVAELQRLLEEMGGGLHVLHGRARDLIPQLAHSLGAQAVYVNHDYEPQANDRDAAVARELASEGRALHTCKDQVIFEKNEVLFQDFLGRIDGYREKRDYRGVRGVSCLSVHLRFGAISIRELARTAASVQSRRFYGDGRFIRMYLQEPAKVNSDVIHEPWKMSLEEQRAAAASVGLDYP